MFFSTLFFVPPPKNAKAVGNTYYVRADGTVLAANKANATSPNAAGTALNMAQVNAATFAAGDQVLFSSQGAGYTSALVLPSSGSGVNSEITYANVPTETPTISAAVSELINTNSRSNVKVIGFSVTYTGVADAFGARIRAGSNITLQYLSIEMGGHGYNIEAQDNISNVLIDTVNLTGTGATLNSIYLFNATNNNITISNSIANAGYGFAITNTTNLTVSSTNVRGGVSLTNVTTATISTLGVSAGIGVQGVSVSGSSNVTINNLAYGGTYFAFSIGSSHDVVVNRPVVTAGFGAKITSTSYNVTVNDGNFNNITAGVQTLLTSHDITFNRTTVTNSADYGFIAQDNSYNITYNNCISNYNQVSGFGAKGSANNLVYNHDTADYNLHLGFVSIDTTSNITYSYSEASHNGTVNVVTDGGGFLPHNSSTNVNIYNCIAHHNYNEGFGDVSSGNNTFYNSVNWANGYATGDTFNGSVVTTPSARGNMYFAKSGGMTTVENVVSGGGRPREILNTGPLLTILNYNLYKPLDDSKFYNTADNVSNTSWATYHQSSEPNSNNADPQFVSTVTPDFNLQSTSPAIDAGIDLNINTDYAGKQRYDDPDVANTGSVGAFSKNYVDIGAYEYVTPPLPGLSSATHPSPVAWYASATPQMTVNPTSATTTYKYTVNQTLAPTLASVLAGTASATATFTVAGGVITSDGVWYVHVAALNLDNDSSTNYGTYTIQYDGTSPTASMTINPFSPDGSNSWYVTQPSISLLATDLVSGINAILFHWDSAADSAYISAFNATEGTHTLFYHSVDNAGNSSATGVSTIIVDTTPPVDFTPTANPAGWTSANSVAISFATTDATSGLASYSIKLDSGVYTSNVASPYTLDVSAVTDGTHTVTVKAIDNAGNIREKTISIYLDKTVPVANNSSGTTNSSTPDSTLTAPTDSISANTPNLEAPSSDTAVTSPSTESPQIKVKSKNYPWWIVSGALLVILTLGFFFFRRRKLQQY